MRAAGRRTVIALAAISIRLTVSASVSMTDAIRRHREISSSARAMRAPALRVIV